MAGSLRAAGPLGIGFVQVLVALAIAAGDRAEVVAILPGAPRFQCQDNDFEYNPASGALSLLVVEPGRC